MVRTRITCPPPPPGKTLLAGPEEGEWPAARARGSPRGPQPLRRLGGPCPGRGFPLPRGTPLWHAFPSRPLGTLSFLLLQLSTCLSQLGAL